MKPTTPPQISRFLALDASLDLIRSLRTIVKAIRARDSSLASQLSRAASSVSLNLAEGRRREGGDRRRLFVVAAGSAGEVRAALEIANAWGWTSQQETRTALQILDRLQRLLGGLTR